MEIYKHDQIVARNGRLCTNVKLSRSKSTAVFVEKPQPKQRTVVGSPTESTSRAAQ